MRVNRQALETGSISYSLQVPAKEMRERRVPFVELIPKKEKKKKKNTLEILLITSEVLCDRWEEELLLSDSKQQH